MSRMRFVFLTGAAIAVALAASAALLAALALTTPANADRAARGLRYGAARAGTRACAVTQIDNVSSTPGANSFGSVP